MKLSVLSAFLLASGIVTEAAADTLPPMEADQLMTAEQLATLVASPPEGFARSIFWQGPNFDVRTLARLVPGEVEIHDSVSDIFIVQEGEAEMLLGGIAEAGRATGPGEHRGGKISGGHIRHLGPGDLLWIPAGMPHQVSKTTGRFRYVVVKIAKPE